MAHVQIRSRSGPNRHPTLTTSLPATCSAKCVQGQHVFWTWRPCMDTTRPPPLLLSPAPLCTQRRAPERPPHPPPLPHSIFLAWIFLFCLWQHARRAPPWQASPARASATASRSRPRPGPGVTTAGRGQAADWLPAATGALQQNPEAGHVVVSSLCSVREKRGISG